MTNNFDLYKEYITLGFDTSPLPKGDTYFVIELMRRGKDNPDMPAANYHFKNYYIRKPEDLDKYRNEPSPIKYPATVHSEIVDNGIDNPFSFYVMYYSFSYDR
jgi:hypothetical protein